MHRLEKRGENQSYPSVIIRTLDRSLKGSVPQFAN